MRKTGGIESPLLARNNKKITRPMFFCHARITSNAKCLGVSSLCPEEKTIHLATSGGEDMLAFHAWAEASFWPGRSVAEWDNLYVVAELLSAGWLF